MPFIGENDDPKFVRGFECGQIWECLKSSKKPFVCIFHNGNIDQVHLMCEYFKVKYDIYIIDETWSSLTINNSIKQ